MKGRKRGRGRENEREGGVKGKEIMGRVKGTEEEMRGREVEG